MQQGESFDHRQLHTLILATTVSRKKMLQQYADRLHREPARFRS
jgi:hypothetical protein